MGAVAARAARLVPDGKPYTLAPAPLYPRGRHFSHPVPLAVFSLYLLHCVHRTFVYPLRLHFSSPDKAAGFHLLITLFAFAFAFAFALLDAYLQSRSISHCADYTGHRAQAWSRVAVFFWGMAIDIASDSALVRLKAEREIPRGGWFELVSCPNYMGEMMDWLGWAVMAWPPATLGSFLYSCSDLGPRARANLQCKFGHAYPKSRKASVPFIY